MECVAIPTPFDVAATNCYMFTGDELTVLDPGPETTEAYERLQEGLQSRGFSIDSIDRILITHPHVDHFGGANRLKQEAGARVLGHESVVDRLADPVAFLQRDIDLSAALMEAHGTPPAVIESMPDLAARFEQYQQPVTVDRPLEEGDHVDVGGTLKVLHTPGHAPGSICLVSSEQDVVFTGDHVLQDITPNPSLAHVPDSPDERVPSLPLYLESLDKLASVGVQQGYAGHGEQISDVPRRIEAIQTHHDERKNKIAAFVDSEERTTAYRILKHLFPDLASSQTVFGFAEVIGHIDLLESEHRVSMETGESSSVVIAS